MLPIPVESPAKGVKRKAKKHFPYLLPPYKQIYSNILLYYYIYNYVNVFNYL